MVTRPPGSRSAPDRGEQVGHLGPERGFALGAGAALMLLGLAGAFGNPLVGRPESTSLIVTGPGHDIIHLIVGALLVHAGVVLSGRQRSYALVVLGGFMALSGLVSLITPDLLGLYGLPTSGLDQLGHLVLGVAAMALGWLGRSAARQGGAIRGARASRPSPPRRSGS